MKISLCGVLVGLADTTMAHSRPSFRGRNRWRVGGSRGFSGWFPREDVFDPNFGGGRGRDFSFPRGGGGDYAHRGRGGSFPGETGRFRPRLPRRTDDYRHWEYATSLPPSHCEGFIVVSYNILADYLARDHYMKLYDHIPPHILDWERRKRSIVIEVGWWDPDIMCLQEVDKFQELLDELKFKGYNGTWKMRTGLPVDGCATFWRSNRFVLVHEENIEFNQLGLRDNVAQICVLESSKCQAELGPETSSSRSHSLGKPKQLVVCNVHVHYNPNRGEIKLGQVRVLLDRAHAVSKLWNDAPVVICGDFNCTPKSPLYNFISQQKLELPGFARNEISGQYSAYMGPPVSDYGRYTYSQGYGRGNETHKQQAQSYSKDSSSVGSFLVDGTMSDRKQIIPDAPVEGNRIHPDTGELKIGEKNFPLNDEESREFCQSLGDISVTDTDKVHHLHSDEVIRLQDLDLNERVSKGTTLCKGAGGLACEFTQISVNMQMSNLALGREQGSVVTTEMEIKTMDCNQDASFKDAKPSNSNMSVQLTTEASFHLDVEHEVVGAIVTSNLFLQRSEETMSRESPCSGHINTCLKSIDQQVQYSHSGFDSTPVAYASASDTSCGLVSSPDPAIAREISEEIGLAGQSITACQELSLGRMSVSAGSSGTMNPLVSLHNVVGKDIEIDEAADSAIVSHKVKLNQLEVASQEEPSIPTGPQDDEAKKSFYDPCTWHPAEVEAASGDAGCTCVKHHLQLWSVYTEVEDFSGTRDSSREPQVTSYNRKFMGTVDYIWRSKGLQTIKVLDTLPKHVLQRTRGFPTHKWGSDHLAIACQLAFVDDL